jgi:flagella basal body P-ring formation protein FlgA
MCFFRPAFNQMIFGLLGIMSLAVAAVEAIQPLNEIQKRARDFLLAQSHGQTESLEIRVEPLDPRLRLNPCGKELEAFQPGGSQTLGNTTVGIRCPGPQPWTLYVRVGVRIFAEVLVAARFLPAGTTLSASDLRTERRELSLLAGNYETVPERLIGKRLRRSQPVGRVIPPQAVMATPLIKKGERVIILAHQNGMEVSTSGIALDDADLGERLRVRNESSQKVIEGKVIAAQRIEVIL